MCGGWVGGWDVWVCVCVCVWVCVLNLFCLQRVFACEILFSNLHNVTS